MALKHKKLKRALYQTSQLEGVDIEKYVIENLDDLKAYTKVINVPKTVVNNWTNSLNEGRIIITTDPNVMTGYPTYTFESKDMSHPSNYVRVKNI